jgi:hypothetical protein
MKKSNDKGSSPIELLVFGVALPALVVQAGLGLFAAERHAIQAQQLAREAVRFASLGEYSGEVSKALVAEVLDSSLDSQSVRVVVTPLVFADGTQGFEAKATVLGSTEIARMRDTR